MEEEVAISYDQLISYGNLGKTSLSLEHVESQMPSSISIRIPFTQQYFLWTGDLELIPFKIVSIDNYHVEA